MIPDIIVVDEEGPETGADLRMNFVLVKEKNAEFLIKSFKHFFPDRKFKVMTKKEYLKWQKR